jgi:membrane fusion protein, multidrug efflux system
MTRPLKRTLVAITLAAALACAKNEAPKAAEKQAPPLPSDVQSVSAAAAPAVPSTTAASPTSKAPSGDSAPAVASESGDTIVATGEFVSPVRSELSSKLAGRVGKVYVDEGSRVSQGQPVLELETDYVRLNLQRAEADVARARAAADDARRDLDRKKELIAKQSIPQATFDRSQSAFDQAQAALQSAGAQAALYRQQLSDSTLRSPIDGVVAEKRTEVGQRLGDQNVTMVIAQTSPLKLRFRVPERYLAAVRQGLTVKATVDPYPNETFEGKVAVVGGVIDSATRSFLVETEFPNRDGKLRPGLFARVELNPGKG